MTTRNPYDVLGVETTATSEEIRSAYIKRTKVLHPDRFDQTSQAVEWQMANDMLQELNEAYADLNSRTQEPSQNNGHQSQTNWESNGNSTDCNLEETQNYWNDIGALYSRTDEAARQISPIEKDNFDQHLNTLKNFIRITFESELALASLVASQVDPLAVKGQSLVRNALVECSRLFTERITLLERAKFLKNKYPYWKTFWNGYWAMGISTQEYKADQAEWNTIDPRLIEIGKQVGAVEDKLRSNMQALGIQLVAKFNGAFQA